MSDKDPNDWQEYARLYHLQQERELRQRRRDRWEDLRWMVFFTLQILAIACLLIAIIKLLFK